MRGLDVMLFLRELFELFESEFFSESPYGVVAIWKVQTSASIVFLLSKLCT